jgi:predicted transcriptional regulator YdeE
VEELKDWAAICGQVFLWDYNIQFANLVSPFPNLNTLAPNMRFFVNNSVRSLFSQCNREIGGEMAELRGYMLSKLMWDPTVNPREVMEDFVEGYFGAAAPYIQHYIDTLHEASHVSGEPLGIFHGPRNARGSYLSQELCVGYDADFDAAEAAVAGQSDILARVRVARLPLLYAELVLQYGSREKRLTKAAYFARVARDSGLQKVEEWHITVDQFITDTLAFLGHDRFEYGRASLPAFSLLGITASGTIEEIWQQNQHRVDKVISYVEFTEVINNLKVYSQNRGEQNYVGLKMLKDAAAVPEGYERMDIPAQSYVTVACEDADLALARREMSEYLKNNDLAQAGEIFSVHSLTGGTTLYCPIISKSL